MEQNGKRLFYIQLMENFFESEDMQLIADFALEKEMDPSTFQFIYLKLILKSLKNDGIIKSDYSIISPQIIKAKIGFRTNRGYNEDIKTIDECIKSLKDAGLVLVSDKALFICKALELTMNKQEDSQKRFIERRKNKVLEQELKLQSMNALDPVAKEELLLDSKISDEWIPGLLYCGYATRENQSDFVVTFNDLYDSSLTIDEISQAVKIFVKRSLDTDYTKIVDKKNYLYKTIRNIIIDEVRACSDIYDPLFKILQHRNVINGISDLKAINSVLLRFERLGFSKLDIRSASLNVFSNNLPPQDINSFESELHKVLNEVPKKEVITSQPDMTN